MEETIFFIIGIWPFNKNPVPKDWINKMFFKLLFFMPMPVIKSYHEKVYADSIKESEC